MRYSGLTYEQEVAGTGAAKGLCVRALRDEDAASWDRYVEACPSATFFHKVGWRQVIETSFGHGTHYLWAERGGRMAGVLPLVHVKSRLFGNRLSSTAFCDRGGPAADDDEAGMALLERAQEIAGDLDVDFLECRSPRLSGAMGWHQRADLYASFRRDLDPDPERNFQRLHRKRRAMIRKGIGEGLEARSDDHVETLHHIFAVSVRNLGTPVLPMRYFRALKEVFRDQCHVLTVSKGGTPVSSVMIFYFRDEVLPYHAGSERSAWTLAANDFMYWEVMRRAVERGCRTFDFGRSKVGTGSFAFKKNWGFEPRPLAYSYWLRNIKALPEINPLNPKYRAFIWCWKRLPLPLSKALGPALVRGLG